MDALAPAADLPSRAAALRAIHRLRAGLPPADRLEDLTVGATEVLPLLRALLQPDGVGGRCLLVIGDYGHGKTHVLTLFRELAHASNLATCQLSIDGAASALNHPQRFLPGLLSTLCVPGRPALGYEDLLHNVLSDIDRARCIRAAVRRHLPTSREVDLAVQANLDRLVALLQGGGPDAAEEVRMCLRRISAHLSGQTICHRSGTPDVRSLAYALLQVAGDILRDAGLRGLALVIDEAESIYTKLPNARSRQGATRVLAALSAGPCLASCPVAVALTPDAERSLAADIGAIAATTDCLPGEPLGTWASALKAGRVPRIACRDLRPPERVHLLDRVFALYLQAYPVAAPKLDIATWQKIWGQVSARDVSVRLLIRQAIDLLDSHRYQPS
jgi:hypothetical protein